MAINNVGYRNWDGRTNSDLIRWMVISSTGIARSWQNMWLRRLLIGVWIPTIWFATGFFAWEQALENPELLSRRSPVRAVIGMTIGRDMAMMLDYADPIESREVVWAWLLHSFMRYPQLIILVLMVGMIAPPLISQDIRSRAFLLYFSRPLNRLEYLAGKLATVWCYLALISIVPGLLLYALGVVLSPSLDVFFNTWDLPLRACGSALVMMIPSATIAVCLSSLTQESRNAAFAWFAIWVLGWVTYVFLAGAESLGAPESFSPEQSRWAWVSLYHLINRVQSWIFGFSTFDAAFVPLLILSGITISALVVLFWRVAAPMKA